MFTFRLRISLFAILILAATAVAMPLQNIYASLTGTVKDENGAVVSDAKVRVVNAETGLTRVTVSDERGDFLISQLPAGSYTITVDRQGFRKEVHSGIVLRVDQRAREDFHLRVGATDETLEVTATAPIVDSETSSVGYVIDNQKINELPLNGRDFTQLAVLVPGASPSAQGTAHASRGGFNVAGARETTNSFLLDGVDNNDQAYLFLSVRPSLEMIQEFKIQSNSYSAEFGRYSGAQVNVTTKSGTNDFHGSAFEFIRNSALDAKNFFDSPAQPIPPFKRNQYGLSLGGPIKENKTFFFGSWEGLSVSQALTFLSAVPTQAMLRGDFSILLVPGNPYIPRTPTNPNGILQLRNPVTRQPIPGNLINDASINGIGRAVAAKYPQANRPVDPIVNFISNPILSDDADQFNIRVDHQLNDKVNLFGRYSIQEQHQIDPSSQPVLRSRIPGYGAERNLRAQNMVFSYTHILSATSVNELRLGYNRFSSLIRPETREDGVGELGITGLDPIATSEAYFGFPEFRITGFEPLGPDSAQPLERNDNTYHIVDNFSWSRGAHALRFGVDFLQFQLYQYFNQSTRGIFSFSGRYSGFGLADLLFGVPDVTSRLLLTGSDKDYTVHNTHAFYVQDDWKALPNLTLNLGLRYEADFPTHAKRNQLAAFNPSTRVIEIARVVEPTLDPRAKPLPVPIPVPIVETDRDTLCDMDKNNVAPRVGFAYRPFDNNSTVIRGGYGIYYLTDRTCASTGLLWRIVQQFNGNPTTPNLTLTNPFPAVAAPGALPLNANIPELHISPYMQQWNFGVQREVLRSMVVDIAYVGSKGTHLPRGRNINQAVTGTTPIATRRPFAAFGVLSNVPLQEYTANSTFHSLQTRVEQRLRAGLSFLASYTFSKSIDDDSGTSGGGVASGAGEAGLQNSYDLRANRGLSTFDVRHRFVFSHVWELPVGAGKQFGDDWHPIPKHVLGGWEISGIVTLMSGRPITPILQGDFSGTGQLNDRPDALRNPNLPSDERSPERWFDTSAFSFPLTPPPAGQAGRFGNAGRGIITGPEFKNVDFSAVKSFRFRETHHIQFRAEFFNLFNHPNFQYPNRVANSAQFGRIFGALPSRQIQFGLRYWF